MFAPTLELKHGLLPGFEVSAGTGLTLERFGGETATAPGDLELSVLLNLTVETRTLPALGVRATGHLPLEADREATFEIKGLATRGLAGPVRLHVNGAWIHMMHDVISDILVSVEVADKRQEIYRQADHFRDPEFLAVSRQAWIDMALAQGVDAQGGAAVGFLPPVPTLAAEPNEHPDHDDPDHQHAPVPH